MPQRTQASGNPLPATCGGRRQPMRAPGLAARTPAVPQSKVAPTLPAWRCGPKMPAPNRQASARCAGEDRQRDRATRRSTIGERNDKAPTNCRAGPGRVQLGRGEVYQQRGICLLFVDRLQAHRRAVEQRLTNLLGETSSDPPGAARLCEAMRYAALGSGKRFRPFLVIEAAALFGVPQSAALDTAAAVECVHCYFLVHADLPAMDSDDLRR